MKKTIRLSESDLHRMIKETVRKAINEMNYDEDMIDLDGSVVDNENGVNTHAANLWFENGTIVVRWVEENNGADATSELLQESPERIWAIIKSIRQ